MYGDLKGGFEFISDTAEHTGRFSSLIYFKEDTVISAITVQNATGNSLAGEPLWLTPSCRASSRASR